MTTPTGSGGSQNLSAQRFCVKAVHEQMWRVQQATEILAADPENDRNTILAQIAVADLMTWACGYAQDIRKRKPLGEKRSP